MPDQGDRVQGELVEDANDVITHQLERIRARAVAFPVPTQIDGDYLKERRELGRHDVPGPTRLAESVQQHHRRRVGRPLDVARQPDIADLDIKVLAHPGDPSDATGCEGGRLLNRPSNLLGLLGFPRSGTRLAVDPFA